MVTSVGTIFHLSSFLCADGDHTALALLPPAPGINLRHDQTKGRILLMSWRLMGELAWGPR